MEQAELREGHCELPPHTFRSCGVMPASGRDRVTGCEIVEVASGLTREMVQTAKLFAWSTGIGEINAIDDATVALFCDRLEQIPIRFGTSPPHFDRPVDGVIREAQGLNAPTRDISTIARHRSRIMTLRSVHVPGLEARVAPGYRVDLDGAEWSAIAGWRRGTGVLAVTRLGRVVYGVPLPAFADDRSAGREKVVRAIVEQADEVHSALTVSGRAFVMTCHERRVMRIVPGFWAASK